LRSLCLATVQSEQYYICSMVTASVKGIASGIEILQPLLTHHTAMLTLFKISIAMPIL